MGRISATWRAAKLAVGSKLKKHVKEPYNNMRDAHGYLKKAVDKGNAAEAAKWRKIRNQQARKLAVPATLGVGAVAGAGWYGAKKTGRGVKTAAGAGWSKMKNVGWFGKYDFMILAMIGFYFFLGPFYRANLGITITFYTIITLFVYLLILEPSEKNPETMTLLFIIWAVEVLLPWLAFSSDLFMSNKFVINYLINPQITLMWLYFAVFRSPRNTWGTKAAYIGVWLLWTGIALSLLYTTYSFENFETPMTPRTDCDG